MNAALQASQKESSRALLAPVQSNRKRGSDKSLRALVVKHASSELRSRQANSEAVTRSLTEINENLSSCSFQGCLRDGNLALAERQINEVLSKYQQSLWQKGLQLSAVQQQQTRSKSLHALHEHVQGFFTLCLQRKKLASALSCARILPPSPSLFTALLKACLDHGDFQAVAQAVEVRKQVGIPEDAFCYTALLKAAAKEQNPARTEALFDRAWQNGIRGAPIFNVLISQHTSAGQIKSAERTASQVVHTLLKLLCARSTALALQAPRKINSAFHPSPLSSNNGRSASSGYREQHSNAQYPKRFLGLQEAFAVYDKMLHLGVEPDVVTMNLVIKAAGAAGRMDAVEQLYDQMTSMGPTPTSITFVHLFAAFQNSLKKDYAWLSQVYRDMLSLGIQLVKQHLVTFLGACCEAPMSGREIQKVFAQAMAFCASQGGDCAVYAALLKFSVSQGTPEKAVEVWKAIQRAKHKMDSWVYAALFSACAAYKSPEHCMILTQAYHSLQNHYKTATAKRALSTSEQRGQRIAFNALLNACAKTGMMAAAEELLASMLKHGPSPDIISYNTLISGHALAANTKGAFDTFYQLCEESSQATASAFRLRPNSHTFGSMLHSCARAGNADSAKKVLELMKRAGVAPTAEAYTSLMSACMKQGSHENIAYAFEVFELMQSEAVSPSAVTYGCLMHGCELQGKIDQAIRLYEEACSSGVFPSDECHNTLVNMFAKNSRLEEVLEVVQSLARQKGRGFQAGAMNSLARALAPEYVSHALGVLRLLQHKGLHVHRDTYVALIEASTQESLIDIAHGLYWALSNEGAVASQEAGSRLIMSLCKANQVQSALAVYDDMVLASNAAAVSLGSAASRKVRTATKDHGRSTSDGNDESDDTDDILHARRTDRWDATPQRSLRLSDMTAADRLGLRRNVLFHGDWAAAPTRRKERLSSSKSSRHKRAVFPHSRAMAALVQAFANQNLEKAFELYCQLQQDSAGAAAVTLSDRFMWQSLIEAACRKARLDIALQVYDDWKDYCATQEALHRFDDDTYTHVPRLSIVTLAFLEACCRAKANQYDDKEAQSYQLRVYDVCATMRQQQDRKVQATLPRPRKASHHFADTAGE